MYLGFTKVRCLSVILLLCGIATAFAQTTSFKEGIHYTAVPSEQLANEKVKQFFSKSTPVQVVEFFSYGCYGCRLLRGHLIEWMKIKPAGVKYVRFPVVFHRSWELFAKAFYALEEMGAEGEIGTPLFKAIHDEHLLLGNPNRLKSFVAKEGVNEEKFSELLNSFLVDQRLRYALDLESALQITVSPSVMVHTPKGNYITNPSIAGGEDEMIQLVRQLVEQGLHETKTEE